MKTNRILAALALVLAATTAQAQGGAGAQGGQGGGMGQGQGGGRMNAMLFKDITLSADQQKKVDSIQMASREASRALMQGGGGMQDSTTRAKMMDIRKKQYDDIRKVLTPEQVTTFDKNIAAMPAMGQGGGGRPPLR